MKEHEFRPGGQGESAKDRKQEITLTDRKNLKITGVQDVIAFDETCVLLDTTLGRLHVKGEELKVKSLDEQACVLLLEGKIDSLAYSGAGGRKQGGSVFRRLFG